MARRSEFGKAAMAGSQSEAAAPSPAANPMAALLGGVLADFWLWLQQVEHPRRQVPPPACRKKISHVPMDCVDC